MSRSPAYDKYPEHTITIDDRRVSVRVSIGEVQIASSTRARSLREGGYQMLAIKGHIAFYPERTSIEILDN